LFTAGGQQGQLLPGQSLAWTPRNELLKVTPVVRDGATDDRESYRYDAGSQRILKVSVQKTGNGLLTQRALYLPGLEVRSTQSGNTETESLDVITVGEAGRAQVRVLHWENGKPEDISNDQLRYSYDNLTGSSGLELDGNGNIISMEEFYPYGGTSVWTARSAVEADYKTVRYSGKERDATGLYYYGYRYYQPWAGRWLSADPAGTVDGLNLFRM
ncbi:RHS repeat-associated core domain-containing protein, partial [Enterobacter kobei]